MSTFDVAAGLNLVSGDFRFWLIFRSCGMVWLLNLVAKASRLKNCDSGATVIEYALIASLLSMLIVGGATAIGIDLFNIFTAVAAGFALK